MRPLTAAFVAAVTGSAAATDWKNTWGKCADAGAPTPAPTAQLEFKTQTARRLASGDVVDPAELKEAHQIVALNNVTGKLEVNQNATLWTKLEAQSEQTEVHIVVVYGYHSSGKSTLASMLSCALNGADEATTTEFPGAKASAKSDTWEGLNPHTFGVWASDPFKYKGPDGTGVEKTYVVFDIQGLDHTRSYIPGLSQKVQNDAATKIIAMLSEVSSEFIYVASKDRATINQVDLDHMGLAWKSTREGLVKTGPDFMSDEDAKVNIRSTDSPGLIFVTRELEWGSDKVVDDNLAYKKSVWADESYQAFTDMNDDSGVKVHLNANFKNHSVGTDKISPFLFNPLVKMEHQTAAAYDPFVWTTNTYPFRQASDEMKQGDACRAYKAMSEAQYTCTVDGSNGAQQPSSPPTYKVLLDSLAKEIYEHAPNRQVTYNALADPKDLTGHRLKGFLAASVEEINKAGPVRDNELWRLIMEDRCKVDYAKRIKDYYNGYYVSMNDARNQIVTTIDSQIAAGIPVKDYTWNPENIKEQNATFITTWTNEATHYQLQEDLFFQSEALLMTVRTQCAPYGFREFQKFDQKAKRLFSFMHVLGEQAHNRILADNIRTLREEINALWWQANLPYIVGLGSLGLIACYILMNMFGQVCTTCKACAMCCGDLTTTDHTHKVVHVHHGPDGTELQGAIRATAAPQIPGVAVAPAAVAMGGVGDAALNQRIEELEAVVLQLAAKVPKKDLEEMNLKGV